MILVTGGTGFIGTLLVKHLLESGHSVRLLCQDPSRAPKGVEVIKGGILDREPVREALKGVEQVIHVAGLIDYKLPRDRLFLVNMEGTRTLLDEAKEVDKFIFASSVSVYGETQGPATEETQPHPKTFYAESKLAAEELVLKRDGDYLALRIGVVFGVGSPIWEDIMGFFSKGFPLPKSKNMMNLVHVSDVVRAFEIGLTKGTGIYNIAGKTSMPFVEFASLLAYHLQMKPKFWPVWLVKNLAALKGKRAEMGAFLTNREYDISKAKRDLNWEPEAYFEKEIKLMAEWYVGKTISSPATKV